MSELEQCRVNLGSDDLQLRVDAATRLSQAGPDASLAAVELVRACNDQEEVQSMAVAALEDMGPPPVPSLESLKPLTQDPHPLVAYWAITLLGRLGLSADGCQSILADILQQSGEASVVQRTAWALGEIGGDCESAKAALTDAATSADERLARLAQQALTRQSNTSSTS